MAGSRGGWSTTLKTKNLMADPRPQESLSQSLQRGAAIAHRHFPAADGIDQRNFRRCTPIARNYKGGKVSS